MKTLVYTLKNSKNLQKLILTIMLATISFYLLNRWGVPPAGAILLLLFARRIMHIIYQLICFIGTIAAIIYLISLLIF